MRGRRASSLIDEGRGNGELIFVSFPMKTLHCNFWPLRAITAGLRLAATVKLQLVEAGYTILLADLAIE